MKKTQKQIGKSILQAILSDTDVYNISEVTRRSKCHYRTVEKHLPSIFEDMKARIQSFNIMINGLPKDK